MTAGDQAAPLEDPSDMKKEQIVRLLEHWRRPVPASDLFRFSHVLVNGKSGELEAASYTHSLGPQSFPHNSVPSTTIGPENQDESGDVGEIVPAPFENFIDPQLLPQDNLSLPPATAGPQTQDECGNVGEMVPAPVEHFIDPQLLPQGNSLGQDTAHGQDSLPSPTDGAPSRDQPHQNGLPFPAESALHAGMGIDATFGAGHDRQEADTSPAGCPDSPRATTRSSIAQAGSTPGNVPPGLVRPRPKARPKGRQAQIQAQIQPEPPAAASDQPVTDLNPDRVGDEVEGVLGRSRRQPKKRKLDACLTMQFEAVEREQERERAKLNKAREEKQAKRDAHDGQPGKRKRT